MHRNARGRRGFLHRRKGNFLTAPAWTVRLSDHRSYLEIRLCEEVLERGDGEQRRATENNSHACPRHSLRRGSSRLQSLPLALFLELFDFSFDEVALEHAEMLQKQDAVQVIDFVAESAGHQVFGANLKRFAFGILCADGDELRAHHVAAKPRYGQAAFFLANFTF